MVLTEERSMMEGLFLCCAVGRKLAIHFYKMWDWNSSSPTWKGGVIWLSLQMQMLKVTFVTNVDVTSFGNSFDAFASREAHPGQSGCNEMLDQEISSTRREVYSIEIYNEETNKNILHDKISKTEHTNCAVKKMLAATSPLSEAKNDELILTVIGEFNPLFVEVKLGVLWTTKLVSFGPEYIGAWIEDYIDFLVKESIRSSILGEAHVNLARFMSSKRPVYSSLPLENCNYGTILQDHLSHFIWLQGECNPAQMKSYPRKMGTRSHAKSNYTNTAR